METTMRRLIPAASGGQAAAASDGSSRREFLQAGGAAAAGAAMIVATPKVASLATGGSGAGVPPQPKAVVTEPSGPAPAEPVTAFVRDAQRAEVTVLFGEKETTYTDPVLVKRLLDAAN
jgi:TAT (twin-arginine translocation) pathway signal sequence